MPYKIIKHFDEFHVHHNLFIALLLESKVEYVIVEHLYGIPTKL